MSVVGEAKLQSPRSTHNNGWKFQGLRCTDVYVPTTLKFNTKAIILVFSKDKLKHSTVFLHTKPAPHTLGGFICPDGDVPELWIEQILNSLNFLTT